MKLLHGSALAACAAILALTGVARAETKVEMKGVHLCCPGCVKRARAEHADGDMQTETSRRSRRCVDLGVPRRTGDRPA